MKNKLIIIIIIFLIIFFVATYMVYSYRKDVIASQEINESYTAYYNKQIYGTELISIINKTIDLNEQNGIPKNNGVYIENENNSIKIYIQFKYKEDYETVDMEKIYNTGTDNFRKAYSSAYFTCSNITYHEKTNNVKTLTFTET